MENLEIAVLIIATCLSGFWLAWNIGAFFWIVANWQRLKHMHMTVEWPMFVFTPMSIGWFIYLGVTYL